MKRCFFDNQHSGVEQRDGFLPPVHVVCPVPDNSKDIFSTVPCLITQDGFCSAGSKLTCQIGWSHKEFLLRAFCTTESITVRSNLAPTSPDFWRQDHIEFRVIPDTHRDLYQIQVIIASDGRAVLYYPQTSPAVIDVVNHTSRRSLDDGTCEWIVHAELPFQVLGFEKGLPSEMLFHGLIAFVLWKGDKYYVEASTACELGFTQAERFGKFKLSAGIPPVILQSVTSSSFILKNISGQPVSGCIEVDVITQSGQENVFTRHIEIDPGLTEIEWQMPLRWPLFTSLQFMWICNGIEFDLGTCSLRDRPPAIHAVLRSGYGSHPYLLFDDEEIKAVRAKLVLPLFRHMKDDWSKQQKNAEKEESSSDWQGSFDITPRCLNWFRVAKETMIRDGEAGLNAVAKRLWDIQSLRAKEAWHSVVDEVTPSDSTIEVLVDELNQMLRRRDLYDRSIFESVRIPKEGRVLLAKGIEHLSESELVRFNRILLQSAIECMPPFKVDLLKRLDRMVEKWLVNGDDSVINEATRTVHTALLATIPGHETHLHEGLASSTLALAYDAFASHLNEKDRAIWIKLMLRFLDLYLETAISRSWTVTTIANANAVGNAGGGLLGLALWEECPDLAREAVDHARIHIRKWLNWCHGPDGGNTEGAQYWAYGMENFLRFALALKRFTGHGDGLLEHPAVRCMMNMVRVGLCNDGAMHGVNDTIPMPVGGSLGWFTASYFGDSMGLWYGDHAWRWYRERKRKGLETPYCSTFADALLYRPPVPERINSVGLPTCYQVTSTEFSIIRSSPNFDCLWTAGIKGSRPPYTHHNQPDTGSFYLDLRGERLMLDPGYYKGKATDHCVPLISGKGPCKPVGWTGRVIVCEERNSLRWLAVDSTGAYEHAARRVVRHLAMVDTRALALIDDIVSDSEVTTLLQCGGPVEKKDENFFIVHGRKAVLGMWLFGPRYSVRIMEERSLKDIHWGYSFADTRWFPMSITYYPSEDHPFVIVFTDIVNVGDTRPAVTCLTGEIRLLMDDQVSLRLVAGQAGWSLW